VDQGIHLRGNPPTTIFLATLGGFYIGGTKTRQRRLGESFGRGICVESRHSAGGRRKQEKENWGGDSQGAGAIP